MSEIQEIIGSINAVLEKRDISNDFGEKYVI